MDNRKMTHLVCKIYHQVFFPPENNHYFKNLRKEILITFYIPGHGSWYQNCYLLHKVPVLVEAFPQGKQDHYRREKLGQLGGEYDGGGGDAENGGYAAESNLCVGVLMHGDSVMTLHMASAGGSRKVAVALQEDQFLLQHQMQFSLSHLVTNKQKSTQQSNDQI